MAGGVAAAHDDPFFVPFGTGADVGRAIAERQAAAAAIGDVGLGAMQQQVGVDRKLAGLEDAHSRLLIF